MESLILASYILKGRNSRTTAEAELHSAVDESVAEARSVLLSLAASIVGLVLFVAGLDLLA